MKINNLDNLCGFIQKDLDRCKHADCNFCPLIGDDINIKGELEVVKECEHDWVYTTTHNVMYRRCKVPGCEAEEGISMQQVIKLFEDYM